MPRRRGYHEHVGFNLKAIMNSYIFDDKSEEREYHRLRLVEAANDSTTIALLVETGIRPGWHCLELGAGAGSILRWLGHRVGPGGLAVGIDKNTVYLKGFDQPPFQVHEGMYPEMSMEQSFDLLHARYVLIHNRNDRAILEHMLNCLKPGGWAVFEEPDFTSATLPGREKETPEARVNRAICRMFDNVGLHPDYALLLPQKLEKAGFEIIRIQSIMHLCPGGSPMAQVMGESALVLQDEYCRTGLCSPEDIQQYVRLSQDPTHWTLYHSTTSAIARKSSP